MKAWLLAGLMLALPSASAQADSPLPGAQASPRGEVAAGNLALALEAAWARNPQASSLSDREAEADARGALAEALTPGPASLTLGHLSDALTGNRGKREWEVELAAPLWLPSQKAARRGEAASAAGQVAARRAALRLQIAGELREAWWSLAAARNGLDLARRRVETAQALETDVLRRYQAGDLARTDANLARGERLSADSEVAEARSALLQAEQVWRAITGLPAPTTLSDEAAPPRETVTGHPRLAMAAAAANNAQARLRVAEATRRDSPELALRLVRDRGDAAESYVNSVGIQLKLPFSSDARVRVDQAAARAELVEAEAELQLIRQQLKLDEEKARASLATSERQLDMARERQTLAADNLRLSEKSFALGESDLTTLLRIRAAAFEAESLLHRQRVARQAAQSRLNQTLGVLP